MCCSIFLPVCLLASMGFQQIQDTEKKPALPEPATVQAWQDAGATVVTIGFGGSRGSLQFRYPNGKSERRQRWDRTGVLPAFLFSGRPGPTSEVLKKLPSPTVPFALCFTPGSNFQGVSDDYLQELPRFKNLRWLDLQSALVRDAGLGSLAQHEGLETLSLGCHRVSGVAVKNLIVALKQLKRLDLHFADDERVKSLGDLKQLRTLILAGGKITDLGVKELAGLTELETLSLACTHVTDVGIEQVATLKQLGTLYVGESAVSGLGFKKLTGLKHLEELHIEYGAVTDAGLESLSALPNLKVLDLTGTLRVRKGGFKHLARLQRLRTLRLAYSLVSDADMKSLSALKDLRTLDLSASRITDAGLKELAALKQLRTLDVSGTSVTEEGVRQLGELLPQARIIRNEESRRGK